MDGLGVVLRGEVVTEHTPEASHVVAALDGDACLLCPLQGTAAHAFPSQGVALDDDRP